MLNDFEEINAILNDLAEKNILEPMIEPIDDGNLEIYLDEWASVVGVADEFYPEYDAFEDDGSF
jgi:hypothetical protein